MVKDFSELPKETDHRYSLSQPPSRQQGTCDLTILQKQTWLSGTRARSQRDLWNTLPFLGFAKCRTTAVLFLDQAMSLLPMPEEHQCLLFWVWTSLSFAGLSSASHLRETSVGPSRQLLWWTGCVLAPLDVDDFYNLPFSFYPCECLSSVISPLPFSSSSSLSWVLPNSFSCSLFCRKNKSKCLDLLPNFLSFPNYESKFDRKSGSKLPLTFLELTV